ncbi:hypothetical protein [Mesorhizobium sp. A556]
MPVDANARAQAAAVLRHFQDVIVRRVIVKPDFWGLRIRIGLIAAVLFFLTAGVGFALRERNDELSNVPLILAVSGVALGVAGLILAVIDRSFRQRQYRALTASR